MAAQTMTTTSRPSLRESVLADPDWLQARIGDPRVRVVELDVSPAAYDQGHIPGAVLWNVYRDLKDPEYRPVPDETVEHLLSGSGITPDTTVVCYGYAPALGFWLLKRYGHADVRILDRGREAWRAEGRPWTADPADPEPAERRLADPDETIRAGLEDVRESIGDPGRTILDVRTELEFQGERFWPSGGQEEGGRAGHVPTAVNLPLDGIYDARGSFRDTAELGRVFAPLDASGRGDVITYCTIGARAATAWFVLTYLLHREHVRVYDGSWAEWGRTPSTPVVSA